MKIVKHLLMATLTLCSLSCAAEVLPQPQTTGGLPLMDVMSAREMGVALVMALKPTPHGTS